MSSEHDALVGELRLLAEAVLDRVDRVVQQYAAAQQAGAAQDPQPTDTGVAGADAPGAGAPAPSGGCDWCPVCAIAALVRGESHELLTRLATQVAAIIALIRELLARYLPAPADPGGPESTPPSEPADRGGGFVSIPVTIRP
ncbi:hypothetical protein F8M49_06955 [Rhodococcus zopfii]|uniref:Uncharacterized protein n=1 Tax=Rhodococcus zopfii TaxID=43772 RepID=A0ABU3WML6_9NOCA|nr:hypothetical protein [Rhodococcus zopfii]